MNIKTITAVDGINPVYFGNYAPRFYWFKNLGDSTLYVSAKPNPIAGGDDVSELSSHSSTSIETDEGKVYILGAGKVEIHNTDSKFCPFKGATFVSGGGDVNADILFSSTVYTGTEYNEVLKPIADLKSELIDYLGFGNDGDFIPCNVEGTLGFTITSSLIHQNYGEARTSVGSTGLKTDYTVIIKNENIFAFKHGDAEIHIIVKNKNREYVLMWLYTGKYKITTPLSTTGWIAHTAPINTTTQYTIVPMGDLIDGAAFINLYYIISSRSKAYTNHFVDFDGKIFRLFGQSAHQFAVQVN